uniref:Uncharacterized protein n=1 Tax=Caenorhabditis japonica TaxID=281687 RepID=A0A8R1DHJ6_CAEJA
MLCLATIQLFAALFFPGVLTETLDYRSYVITSHVQEAVNVFMVVILLMIIIFLAVHMIIRVHYKAKTDYALGELREKFDKKQKGPSPYAVSKEHKSVEAGNGKPIEIVLEPEQLAPILHQIAMVPMEKADEINRNVFFKSKP